MIPASTVNHQNYHLLGNRLTGESRASRMKRVNARTPYTPSLIEREPAKMHKINPTKSMNLGSSHGGEFETRIGSMVMGGATAFGLTTLLNKLSKQDRDAQVKSSIAGAIGGLAIGIFAGVALNAEKISFLNTQNNNRIADNITLGITSLALPLGAAILPPEKTSTRTKKQRNTDLKRALMLGAPGVVASFTTNANYTVPIYLASLVGTFAARKYSAI